MLNNGWKLLQGPFTRLRIQTSDAVFGDILTVLQGDSFLQGLALLLGLRVNGALADRVEGNGATGLRINQLLRLVNGAGLH